MPDVSFSKEEFMAFASRAGNKGARAMLERIGRSEQFLRALDLPVGKELLGDLHEQATQLHRTVVLGGVGMPREEKEEKQALLRAYLEIGERWASRINAYHARISEVQGAKMPGPGSSGSASTTGG